MCEGTGFLDEAEDEPGGLTPFPAPDKKSSQSAVEFESAPLLVLDISVAVPPPPPPPLPLWPGAPSPPCALEITLGGAEPGGGGGGC